MLTSTNAAEMRVDASEDTTGSIEPTQKEAGSIPEFQRRTKDALSEPFEPFAHQTLLVKPFDNETHRDLEFQKQLHEKLLELILEMHAWSTSRPELESTAAGDVLVDEAQTIINVEREQGMLSTLLESGRLRLVEFIGRIKAALAVLTDLTERDL